MHKISQIYKTSQQVHKIIFKKIIKIIKNKKIKKKKKKPTSQQKFSKTD